ncbi:MAG: metalloregulator ArsR/SmtB family transcription factor [Perlucidibaca sp.]
MDTHLSPEAFTMLRDSASKACALLKVLANEDRLLLLCQLTQGERNVGELESICGIRQPTLSQQLGVLREEGMVNARREGKYIYYSLANHEVIQVMNTLSSLYCGRVLNTLKAAAGKA